MDDRFHLWVPVTGKLGIGRERHGERQEEAARQREAGGKSAEQFGDADGV